MQQEVTVGWSQQSIWCAASTERTLGAAATNIRHTTPRKMVAGTCPRGFKLASCGGQLIPEGSQQVLTIRDPVRMCDSRHADLLHSQEYERAYCEISSIRQNQNFLLLPIGRYRDSDA